MILTQRNKQILKFIRNRFEYILTVKIRNYNHRKNNNKISIDKNCRLRNSVIRIKGKDNNIIISKNVDVNGMRILIEGNGNKIELGQNVIINASRIHPTIINAIGGTSIKIGCSCLLSNAIEIHTSDYHGIYDYSGHRLNCNKNIIIGEKVWIGMDTKILKGTEIGNGCIIGASSLLSKKYDCTNSIIAGIPAKIIKKDVIWDYK